MKKTKIERITTLFTNVPIVQPKALIKKNQQNDIGYVANPM